MVKQTVTFKSIRTETFGSIFQCLDRCSDAERENVQPTVLL